MAASSATAPGRPRASGWSDVAERGSLLGIRITLLCYRMLGRRLTLPLVFLIVSYFFLTDGPGRRASRAYLRRIHAIPAGRCSVPRPPGLRESFRHYRTFALAIVDRLAIWFGDGHEFEFENHGTETIDRLHDEGRGALILGAHLGSFDALRLLAGRTRNVVNVLMFTENAPLIHRVFRELSPEIEARLITVDPSSVLSVFTIRERLRRGEHVAILADRIEAGDRDRSVSVPLLGGSVQLPQSPMVLAGLLGCPVFMMLALRDGWGRYRVFVEQLSERVVVPRRVREEAVRERVADYARRLERYCLMAPYQWFNFFDYWGDAAARRRST